MDLNAPPRGVAPANERAGRREWTGLAVLGLPTLLLSVDLSVLYLALPHLGADLRPSSTQLLWITDIYGFMIAGFLITMGTLGDRVGSRRLLMIGAAGFGAASVLAAFSTSAGMLIAARALLGIAGATQMPSTLALIRTMFNDPRQRAIAIAAWVSCWTAGAAVGPVVGGVMLDFFWWGSVFLLSVPMMLLLLVAAPLLLPEPRDPTAGRLDLASVALSLATMLPVIYGIKELAGNGVSGPPILALIAGPALGVLFVRRQRKLAGPLLDLSLFASRGFTSALVIMIVGLIAVGGSYLFVTQYLQLVSGLSPLRAALWLLPAALADIAAAMLAPALARRLRPGNVVGAGLLIAAAGFLLLAVATPDSSVSFVVTGLILMHIGIGPMVTLGTDLIVGSAPPQQAGSASSISETSTELGVALGVATLGTLGTAIYRGQVADIALGGVPAGIADATRDGISGAISGAAQLPDPLADDLLIGARAAFTTGLNAVAAVSVALSVALAVLAAVTLRHLRPLGGETTLDEPDQATPGQATPGQATPDRRIRPAPPAHRPPRCL